MPAQFQIHITAVFFARAPGSALPPLCASDGGVRWAIGHNWKGVIKEADFAAHPEYLALIEDERQRGRPCLTHPQVIARFVENAAVAFASGRRAFSLTPHDGTRWLCQCDLCRSIGPDPKKTADRFVLFANTVRTKLDEQYPEFKDRKLDILAGYGWEENRVPPSEGIAALPGVGLWVAHQGCHAHRWDDGTCPINQTWGRNFRGWVAAASGPIGVYEYSCYSNYRWDRKWASFPVVSLRRVVRDIAAYHRAGVGYLYYESEARFRRYAPFRWVDAYAADRAMADPAIDPDKLLHTLCADLYGPAAATMFQFYDLLQTRLEQTPLHRGNWYLPDPAKIYRETDIERLTALIEQAVRQTQRAGGAVLRRCREAQTVWSKAVSSLTDKHRDENGPKQFNQEPW